MGVNNPGINIFAGVPAPGELKTTGRVFYVGNSTTYVPGGVAGTDDTAQGDTPQRPFATLDYAVGQCTASRGDVIHPLPGHAETIATATALAIDVAGVQVYGLGEGNLRPTFTVNGVAGATITVSAANVTWKNCIVIGGLDGLDSAITVTGADCTLDLEYRDTSATVEADIAITASGARFTCKLKDVGFSTGDQREASISMNGVVGARIEIDQYGLVNTAVVNFVTTLCSNVEVRGTTRTSVTDGSRNVVDTITGSLWYMDVIDAAAGARYTGGSAAAVASDDISAITTNLATLQAEVSGAAGITTFPAAAIPANAVSLAEVIRQLYAALEGTAASQNGVATWPTAAAYASNVSIAEVLGYIQDAVRNGTGTGLATNESLADVLYAANGIVTFPAAAAPANGISIAEVLREKYDQQEKSVTNTTATLVSGTTIFTIAGGPIEIMSLVARCVTGNDGTASTLQWSADPTDGAAATFSGASASLASALAGAMVVLQGTTLATAPVVNTTGVGLGQGTTNGIVVGAGIITTTVGVGSTTGTWQHHLRYRPLSRGVTVS